MATRPQAFEEHQEMNPQESVLSSGDLRSRLDKVLPKDLKIPKDRQWARELVREIPTSLLGKATHFIESALSDDQKTERAQRLLAVIRSKTNGVLRASDQEIALQDCIAEVKRGGKPN